ncbi:PAS domain S-box protein [Mucilaginibacter sp. HMF5004]|uniref:PAS domain S-box protein n=1 Tax=Mucilaginibacter rivuli TaxID=2857527 RepID=UPI001C5F268E|nr:PAS domain S-box protein [Mucilaginibacter rivuli]
MDNIYKTILEDTLAGFWDWDIRSGRVYLSPAFKAMFGYADVELAADMETWQSLVYPEDISLVTESIRKHIDSNGQLPHSVEVRCMHKNGSLLWVMSTGQIVERDGDLPVRMAGCHINIDKQKKAQIELQISEQRFRGAFEYSAIGMALVSPEGKWLKANKKLCQMLGYKHTELLKKSFQDITHPEDLGKDIELLGQLLAKEIDSYQLEKRYLHKNGGIVWAMLSVSLVRDEVDMPLHFVSQVEDITLRKKAESELQQSKDQYRLLFRSVQDVFFRVDVNGNLCEISQSIEKYDGYKQAQFIGQPASVFYYDPSEREAVVEALTKYGRINDYDVRLKTPDGHFVYTSINAYAIFDEYGHFAGSEGSIRDITERVLIEEALKERDALLTKLSEQIPGVIYQFQASPDGRYFLPFVSNAIIDLYDLTAEDIRYDATPVFERVHPDDLEAFSTSIIKSFETLEKWEQEFRINVPGADTKWVHGASRPERLEDGSVLWHGFIADVTEQKQKEQQLRHTYDLITEQNSRLVNFAYIISHNLRTHSGNFEMLVKLIEDTHDEDEKAELMQHLKKVSEMLSETIMHLNEVVSVQTSINQQLTTIDLFEYIEKAIEVLTIKTNDKEVIIKNHVPEGFELEYNAAYIESIIFNFLSNGIKYRHPERQTVINVSVYQENDHIILEFADNGLGIDMEKNREKLFGMYRTFHHNADAKGIGLFITKSQVEAMGGKIDVTSEVNKGTSFKITLT